MHWITLLKTIFCIAFVPSITQHSSIYDIYIKIATVHKQWQNVVMLDKPGIGSLNYYEQKILMANDSEFYYPLILLFAVWESWFSPYIPCENILLLLCSQLTGSWLPDAATKKATTFSGWQSNSSSQFFFHKEQWRYFAQYIRIIIQSRILSLQIINYGRWPQF